MTQWHESRRVVAIAGTVSDSRSRAPIAGARIEIVEGPPAFQRLRATLAHTPAWQQQSERLDRTTSRRDGLFFLCNLPAGAYRLRISVGARGTRYGTSERSGIRVAAQRDAAGRIQLDPVEISLPPTLIRGRVTRADNQQPIVAARVRLRGDTPAVIADSDGRYVFVPVSAGTWTVQAEATNFVTGSQVTTVAAGQDQTVDLVLRPT